MQPDLIISNGTILDGTGKAPTSGDIAIKGGKISDVGNLAEVAEVPVLDATPAGENVYLPLGFQPHFGFQRWQHDGVEEIFPNQNDGPGGRNIGPRIG